MYSLIGKEILFKAIETAEDAVFFEDPEGRILLWNRGAEALYGFKAGDILGHIVEGLNTRDIREHIAHLDHGNQPVQIAQRCQDGSVVKIWLSSGPVRNDDGSLVAFQHIGRPVRESLALSGLLESAPNAVLIVNENGAVERMNSAGKALFGYSGDEVSDLSVSSLIPSRFRKNHRHFRRQFHHNPVARPMGAGRDLFGLHKDGHEFPVEIALQPLNEGRNQRRVMVTVVDLSQRVAAEQRFKLAVEAAPCGMLMVDSEGCIALVNSQAEELFGYSRSELLGASIETLVPQQYRAGHHDLRKNFSKAPTARRMGAGRELFGLRKDGAEVPVEIGLNPINTREGAFVLVSIIDSTERRKATEELRRSLKDKEILLQEIHHRVKNNLAVIGSILYLQSSTTDDSKLLRVLQECQDRIRSMSLVHERLYLHGDVGQLDFAEYVQELTQQLARNNLPSSQPISLDFKLESIPLELKQAVPCGLILNELLTNAFQHGFQGRRQGTLSISLRRVDGDNISLEVIDDGPFREEATFEREGSLGLRLVRSLTRQLDGEFEIRQLPRGGTLTQLCFEEVKAE